MTDLVAPAPYNQIRHWKWVFEQLAPIAMAATLCVVLFGYFLSTSDPQSATVFLVLLVPLGARGYGMFKAWQIRPITADAENGVVTVGQKGYWWLFMSNSSPDSFSLNHVQIVTEQSWIEQVFFKSSETLLIIPSGVDLGKRLSSKELRDISSNVFPSVRNANQIRKIYEFWNGKANRLNQEQLAEQRETNRLLRRMVGEPPLEDG